MDYWAEIIKIAPEALEAIAWPVVCVLALYRLKKSNWDRFWDLIGKRKIEVQAKGVKVLVDEMVQKADLPPVYRKELKNLTANEIWALETLVIGNHPPELPPALKVMAITLQEAGLVKIANKKVTVTDEGRELVKLAANLF